MQNVDSVLVFDGTDDYKRFQIVPTLASQRQVSQRFQRGSDQMY